MTDCAPAPGSDDPLNLHGVVPPIVTAFDEEEAVDYERTAEHAQFVVEGGADAVFPLGTNGEFATLSTAERDRVVEATVDAVGGEVPVIAGVGQPGTAETVERAHAAERAGVDGVVVVTPFYYPLDGDAAVGHYRAVAASVDVPVYVYHIPSKTGNELSLETLERIAAVDGIAGLKDSSKDVPWLGQAIARAPELTFVAGSDSLLVPGLDAGCTGLVSAVANAFPELIVDLYEAYAEGDRARAKELQAHVYDVRTAIKRGPYMAGVKEALSLRGHEFGPLRAPLRRMDDDDREALADDLEALDLL